MSVTGNLSGLAPSYRLLDDSEILLTIPAAPIDDRERLHQLVKRGINHQNEGEKVIEDGLNDGIKTFDDGINCTSDGIKSKVLAAIRNHSGIRVPELVLLLTRSKPTIERTVAQLKKEGIIEYRGSKKTGGYFLK